MCAYDLIGVFPKRNRESNKSLKNESFKILSCLSCWHCGNILISNIFGHLGKTQLDRITIEEARYTILQ